jgi:hypothetical protein
VLTEVNSGFIDLNTIRIINGAVVLYYANDFSSTCFKELCCPVSYIPNALDNQSLAFDSGTDLKEFTEFGNVENLLDSIENSKS